MNRYTVSFLISLYVTTLFGSSYSFAEETTNNGTLTFIYDLDEGQCTIPVSDKRELQIYHTDRPTPDQPCKGHSIRYIKFNGVRSAVSVWLGSQFDKYNHAIGCAYLDPGVSPNNFLIELRTTKNMPSNEPIALDAIAPKDVGKPFVPGVLVKSRWVNKNDEVNRELSCIRINFD